MSDSGEIQANPRSGIPGPSGDEPRRPQAASVSNRWWEVSAAGNPGTGGSAALPASPLWQSPPPPPPSPLGLEPQPVGMLPPATAPAPLDGPGAVERRQLEMELEAARAEVAALHEMLEDLPEIFERKFRQRVQSLIGEQQRLLADNQMLRDRLYALTPATPTALPPARSAAARAGAPTAPGSLRQQRSRLRQSLRDALESLRGRSSGEKSGKDRVSDRDDGRTTAA